MNDGVKHIDILDPRFHVKKALGHDDTLALPSMIVHHDTDNVGYIYLLITESHLAAGNPIYKVGFTRHVDIYTRVKQYPKGSLLLYCELVDDAAAKETNILRKMRGFFTHRRDIGKEYFQGKVEDMLNVIKGALRIASCDRQNMAEPGP